MKNHPVRGKTKKTKKTIFFGEWGGDFEKDVFFFGFCLVKDGFALKKQNQKKHLFQHPLPIL